MLSFLTVMLDGLAYGMVLFIISIGLAVTLGLMRVVNLAHGAFAMTGGYIAAVLARSGMGFFTAAVLSTLIVFIIGMLMEITLYRPLYRKGELAQALMTFGLSFVVIATLTTIFGTTMQTIALPEFLKGLVNIGFREYPAYRLFLIGIGLSLLLGLWLLIDGTLHGARIRAAVDNPRMSRAIGINVDLLFTLTFAGGCALAGFGAVIGSQLLMLEPYYALKYLVLFLVVVGVGGVGNFKGSFLAAIALGVIDTAGKYYLPAVSAYLFYGTIIALLLWRPQGLIPGKAAA